MMHLIFKNNIEQNKIDILLSMIKSWDMEAEVQLSPTKDIRTQFTAAQDSSAGTTGLITDKTTTTYRSRKKKNAALTLAVGMWEGRDINDKQLRETAWGTAKRLKR